MNKKITIAVSSCLLGNSTRYDGKHKHDPLINGPIFSHFKLIPICPEVDCGMLVPREPIRPENSVQQPDIIGIQTRTNFTQILKKIFYSENSRTD